MTTFSIENYLKEVEVDSKVKSVYKKRFEEVRNSITSVWYTVGSNGPLVIHVKIPSEKTKNFYYDVLIEFSNANRNSSHKQFRSSPIKVFSNCPSFVYTNAKLCKEKGWLIDWAIDLYNKEVFEEGTNTKVSMKDKAKEIIDSNVAPKVTDIRYEKSLYFAILYLNAMSPIDVMTMERKAHHLSKPEAIAKHIKDVTWIQDERRLSVAKDRMYTYRDKEKSENSTASSRRTSIPSKVSKVSRVSSTKSTGRTRKI